MTKLAKLQLIGPVVVFLAALAAEAAVYALNYSPTSEFLWYINLKLFGLFQQSYYVISNRVDIDGFQFLCIALPLFLVAVFGFVFKRPLALAIASNLSFIYASFVVYCSYMVDGASRQASLSVASAAVAWTVRSSPYLSMIAVLLGSSLLSFTISHVAYFRALRNKA
jgi:hypothetical protein